MKKQFGVQLYGSMKLFREDPAGFLEKLAAAGYTEIEPAIAQDMTLDFMESHGISPVWLPEEAEGFAKLAAEKGLSISSCHIFGKASDGIEIFRRLKPFGLKAVVTGCTADDSDAGFTQFVEDLLDSADALRAEGLECWMHNNAPEIVKKRQGVTLYEAVLDACAGKVGAQPDTGWVYYAGEDPAALLGRLSEKGLLRSIHYKDILPGFRLPDAPGNPLDFSTAMGKGVLDLKGIHALATDSMTEIADQDASRGSLMDDLTESAACFASL